VNDTALLEELRAAVRSAFWDAIAAAGDRPLVEVAREPRPPDPLGLGPSIRSAFWAALAAVEGGEEP
jgi:hypothetical protein